MLTERSLTQTVRDDALEAEVTRIFSRFGTVFVKIRRDNRQMPFAFCQFTVYMIMDCNSWTKLMRFRAIMTPKTLLSKVGELSCSGEPVAPNELRPTVTSPLDLLGL